jgi:hypothetical protein
MKKDGEIGRRPEKPRVMRKESHTGPLYVASL